MEEDVVIEEPAVENTEQLRRTEPVENSNAYSQAIRKKVGQERKTNPVDYRKDYTDAIQAFEDEDYAAAGEYLNKAVEGKNDEQLVLKFYGMRYGSYLPHYYLGRVAYLTGDCDSALAHWNISLAQGVIQETPSYDDLMHAMGACKS
jgi:hypothetical protein